jgi:hypothetical protein
VLDDDHAPYVLNSYHNFCQRIDYASSSLLEVLPKEKIAPFRIENRQFHHPETKEFPDGNERVFIVRTHQRPCKAG